VNLSDVAAMGGRAIAVVDALWSDGDIHAAPMLAGLREAAGRYGVPVVGGHSNLRAAGGQLAVAVLGQADRPITSFGARPSDALIVATDLRGAFRDPFPWWDASTSAVAARLRGDLAILPDLAADRLVSAGKDISMAGVVGTVMMLVEASGVGARIDLDRLPMPVGVAIERWLTAFPSFGFVLTARAGLADEVLGRFRERGIAAESVGEIEAGTTVRIARGAETAAVWDFATPLTGCTGAKEAVHA
jgi:selenophosphate synthetase-related protein